MKITEVIEVMRRARAILMSKQCSCGEHPHRPWCEVAMVLIDLEAAIETVDALDGAEPWLL